MAGFDSGGNRFVTTVTQLSPVQKIALGAAATTLVAGGFLLTRAGGDTAMAVMYTDLEPADAAAVTDELIARNVDYDLADGGRTVLVARDDVYDLRIDLSGEGLPNSNEGYALLDEQGITTSEFRQRVDYQRALEGELARTLRSIDGVDGAVVHLALPEDSVFVDEPAKPTASVLVSTADPSTITGEQVSAMVHLISGSIKDMSPEDVTIADATGRVLTDADASLGGGLGSGSRTHVTEAFEQDLANSLRSMVGRVTGLGHVVVTVEADLELTERQETSERFDSTDEDGVVVAERTATETYAGVELAADAGVLGPDGAPVTPDVDGGETSYSKDDAERTFAVNRTVEQTTYAPGAVNQLNVAVLVDENVVTAEQGDVITEMVTTAAGIDPERGDQVVVTRLPFDTSVSEAAEAAAEEAAAVAQAQDRSSLIRTAIIAFVVLVALLLAYRSAKAARREVSTPIDIDALRAAPTPAALPMGPVSETDEYSLEPALASDDPSRAALEELSALADRRPDEVAQILQGWLADERAST